MRGMTEAAPAATVVLLRDRAQGGFEVLLLRRNSQLAFHGGAWVFPGGRIDPVDAGAGGDAGAARRAAAREAREEAGVAVDPDALVQISHWTTPEGLPKRFDTHFFLIAAPMEQLGAHDGSESVEGLWITPRQALSEAEARTKTLVFATALNLKKLTAYRNVAEAVAATRASTVVTVMPKVVARSPTGRTLRIPAEAGYGVTEVVVPAFIPPAGRE